MNLIQKFEQHLKKFPFIQKNERQLVAVSGGVDSVVLCHLLHTCGYDFAIAHCNFQLRGLESERDEQFVTDLAKRYGKHFFVKKFDTEKYSAENKVSIQVAAREMRYDWFREMVSRGKKVSSIKYKVSSIKYQVLRQEQETSNEKQETRNEQQNTNNEKRETRNEKLFYILTAHHADDNIETVVMNFFRGTGIHGLTGMDTLHQKIFRPLLPFKKEEITAYANERQLAYVEDSSNANSQYTRNFFRNELLPSIKNFFPKAEENILKNLGRFNEAAAIYDEAIQIYKRNLIENKGNEEHISILKLQKQVGFKTILWEIISTKSFTATQTDEVLKLLDAGNGSYKESATHRIIKNRCWLIIAPLHQAEANNIIVISENDKKIIFSEGELSFQHNISGDRFSISKENAVAEIDAETISFPLLLRRWKQGDYFYPLGMAKKKKVSRFLIDKKLSLTEKEKVWVLESNKKIIWIVNQRIDDRCKVTESTKMVLRIGFKGL